MGADTVHDTNSEGDTTPHDTVSDSASVPEDTQDTEDSGTTDSESEHNDSEWTTDLDAGDTDDPSVLDGGNTDNWGDSDSLDTGTEDAETDTGEVMPIEVIRKCEDDCLDFPELPMVIGDVPAMAPSYFSSVVDFETPGPCVVEPQLSDGINPGALFPANWLRPRFRFVPSGEADVFEIRLSATRQKHDLVVYTTETTWTMPQEMWEGLAESVIDEPITVTIRELDSINPDMPRGTSGTFSIAPVRAEGKLVYWATTSSNVQPDTSKLVGFAVGDADVADTLTITQVGDRDLLSTDGRLERSPAYGVGEGCVQCIGCHVATPDGEAVAFGDHWPWNIVVASVSDPAVSNVEIGKAPSYLTLGAERLLNQPWLGMPTFSPAYWNDLERILVTSYGERVTESGSTVGFTNSSSTNDVLAWFDLQTDANLEISEDYSGDVLPERNHLVLDALGTGFGFISLVGEELSAVAPNWSHDGTHIAYTAASKTVDGRLGGGAGQTDVDIHIVPFNEGRGGTVIPLDGADEKDVAEYYPAFSPDDALIVFNRETDFRALKTVTTTFYPPYNVITINGETAPVYYRPHAEIYVIPSEGGTPMRLIANDPPQCTGENSPGVVNSWGKWAPDVKESSESFGPKRSFYWVVFSSARSYPEQFIVEVNPYSPPDSRSSQLYLAAVVRNEVTGEYTNYPAIYLWNQEKTTSNLTPAWDHFKIPTATGGNSSLSPEQ